LLLRRTCGHVSSVEVAVVQVVGTVKAAIHAGVADGSGGQSRRSAVAAVALTVFRLWTTRLIRIAILVLTKLAKSFSALGWRR